MKRPPSHESRQRELIELIRSWDVGFDDHLDADTPLIESGLFDSLAMFNTVLWIEQQLGTPVDPTSVDLASEWNTVNDILRFIDRQRDKGASR